MNASCADEPRELRAEDAFDVAALHAWLAQRVDLPDAAPQVQQLGGGASLPTYLLRDDDRDLVLRRPPTDGLLFYALFGLFRLAGIAQQIFYRFQHGQTKNSAVKHFWFFVTSLESRWRPIAGTA